MLPIIPLLETALGLTIVAIRLAFMSFCLVILAFRLFSRLFSWLFGFSRRQAAGDGELEQMPETFSARVRVVDGDTIAIGDHRIRLYGMDAPESDQPFGDMSTAALRGLIRDEELMIHPIEFDVYGRLVAHVRRKDGLDLSEAMVASGNAVATLAYTTAYAEAQHHAKTNKKGFWANGGTVDPAIWRAAHNAA